jgi:hypothetical protein
MVTIWMILSWCYLLDASLITAINALVIRSMHFSISKSNLLLKASPLMAVLFALKRFTPITRLAAGFTRLKKNKEWTPS